MVKDNKRIVSEKQINDVILRYFPFDIDIESINPFLVEQRLYALCQELNLPASLKDNFDIDTMEFRHVYNDQGDYESFRYQLCEFREELLNIIKSYFKRDNIEVINSMTEDEIIQYDVNDIEPFLKDALYFVWDDNVRTTPLERSLEYVYKYYGVGEKVSISGKLIVPQKVKDYVRYLEELGMYYDRDQYDSSRDTFRYSKNKKEIMPGELEKFVIFVANDIRNRILEKQGMLRPQEDKVVSSQAVEEYEIDELQITDDLKPKGISDSLNPEIVDNDLGSFLNDEIKKNEALRKEIEKREKILDEYERILKERKELLKMIASLDEKIRECKDLVDSSEEVLSLK